MVRKVLLLGVDGGGNRLPRPPCRSQGPDLGRRARPAPPTFASGLRRALRRCCGRPTRCLAQAGLSPGEADIVACLALAGASEPTHLAAARAHEHPFRRVIFTTDAHAACVGAHGGRDGGIIIVGTGSVGWAVVGGREHRVGGWGFPVSDEGSGAWLGCEAARRVLWAYDGRAAWTGLLKKLYERFDCDPHAIVRWMGAARPRDFAALAPLVLDYAARDDVAACELMRAGRRATSTRSPSASPRSACRGLALAGGIAPSIEPWLAPATQEASGCSEGRCAERRLAAGAPRSGDVMTLAQRQSSADEIGRTSHEQRRSTDGAGDPRGAAARSSARSSAWRSRWRSSSRGCRRARRRSSSPARAAARRTPRRSASISSSATSEFRLPRPRPASPASMAGRCT